MGSSCSGGPLLRRAPLRMEDPRAETSGFKESTPVMTSYNKGQCNAFGSSRVGSSDRQAEACARGRLREKKEEGLCQQTSPDFSRVSIVYNAFNRHIHTNPRAMLPLVPAREQQHHDVGQHAGLGHGQLDEDMNLEDMLP